MLRSILVLLDCRVRVELGSMGWSVCKEKCGSSYLLVIVNFWREDQDVV